MAYSCIQGLVRFRRTKHIHLMNTADRAQHWEQVYSTRQPDELSWYQVEPVLSCSILSGLPVQKDDPIIDVGGGASRLVDCLLARGYSDISVLDIAPAALDLSRQRLQEQAGNVTWIEQDITRFSAVQKYVVWHDRAVFHFLTNADDRLAYRKVLYQALKPGGYLIIMSFAPDGPQRCSGLNVVRYDADMLQTELGHEMELLETQNHVHRTPWGSDQSFLCAVFRLL